MASAANGNGGSHQGIRFPFPEFHGDPLKYPHESWDLYKIGIDLAYLGADRSAPFPDDVKKAHILSGLKGPARRYLTVNPKLLTMTYAQVVANLEKRFNRSNVKTFLNINEITQQPGELVMDYASRLQEAVKILKRQHDYTRLVQVPVSSATDSSASAAPTNSTGSTTGGSGGDGNSTTGTGGSNQPPQPSAPVPVVALPPGIVVKTEAAIEMENEVYDEFRDSLLFMHFIRGLRPEFKIAVSARHPQTFQAALQIAEEHERYIEIYGGGSASGAAHLLMNAYPSPVQTFASLQDPAVAAVAKQLQALNHPTTTTGNKQAASPPGQDPSATQCYFCKKYGHYARHCREKTRYLDQQRMSKNDPKASVHQTMPRAHPSNHDAPASPHSHRRSFSAGGKPPHPYSERSAGSYAPFQKNGERPPKGGPIIPLPVKRVTFRTPLSRHH